MKLVESLPVGLVRALVDSGPETVSVPTSRAWLTADSGNVYVTGPTLCAES